MTLRGMGALLLGALLLMAGLALRWSSITAVAVVVLATVAAAVVLAFAAPHPRVARTRHTTVVQRGGTAQTEVMAQTGGSLPAFATVVADRVGDRPVEATVPMVRRSAPRTVAYPLPTDRRGVFEVGPLVTTREDPFGLVRRTRGGGETLLLSVRPVMHEVDLRAVGGRRNSGGEAAVPAREGSSAFHALREYVPGDDRRLVHWKTTARLDKLMVKEGSEASLPEVLMLLDAGTCDADAFEESVDLVASLVAAGSRDGFVVRLLATSGLNTAVAPGPDSLERALDALAALEMTEQPMDVLPLVRGRSGTLAVVVTTDRDRVMDDVRPLAARFRRVVLAEVGTPTSGGADGPVLVQSAPDAADWCRMWGTR